MIGNKHIINRSILSHNINGATDKLLNNSNYEKFIINKYNTQIVLLQEVKNSKMIKPGHSNYSYKYDIAVKRGWNKIGNTPGNSSGLLSGLIINDNNNKLYNIDCFKINQI